jgi:hypothetical protein
MHPSARKLDYPPLVTLDTDVAIPLSIAVGEQDIRGRLLAHGFREVFLGNDRPPATHYHLGAGNSEFYVEFLTPRTGTRYGPKGERQATIEIAGVSSQRLRHIGLLLDHPWRVDFESGGFTAKIQVANPVSFIAQKVLIHKQRGRDDQAKDILYLHDTFEVFGVQLHELLELWQRIVAPQLHAASVMKVSNASGILFGELSDDIRRAARISDHRALSPEAIREACQYGFATVFG